MVIRRRSLLAAAAAAVASDAWGQQTCFDTFDRCFSSLSGSSGGGGAAGSTLDLNFIDGSAIDPRITYTGSNGTRTNSAGTIVNATTNVARFDFDPVTHAPLGLLIEEARTNLITNSVAISTGWTATNVTATAASGTAPDGALAMTRIAEAATTTFHFVFVNVTTVASTAYTYSVYARAAQNRYLQLALDDGSANGIYATFDLTGGAITGAIAVGGTSTASGATMQSVGGGTYRCSIAGVVGAVTTVRCSAVLSATANPGLVYPVYAGNASNGLLIWGGQLELGTFPTSYIPTAGATATRTADLATIPVAGWYSTGAGSLTADTMQLTLPGVGVAGAAEINDGTANNRWFAAYSATTGTGRTNDIIATVGQGVATTANAMTALAVNKVGLSQTVTAASLILNGGTVVQVAWAGGLPPGLTQMQIGSLASGNALNGWVRRVRYWPRALTVGELQQVTR